MSTTKQLEPAFFSEMKCLREADLWATLAGIPNDDFSTGRQKHQQWRSEVKEFDEAYRAYKTDASADNAVAVAGEAFDVFFTALNHLATSDNMLGNFLASPTENYLDSCEVFGFDPGTLWNLGIAANMSKFPENTWENIDTGEAHFNQLQIKIKLTEFNQRLIWSSKEDQKDINGKFYEAGKILKPPGFTSADWSLAQL